MSQCNKDIVVLSTADWDNPFWTNKQHVACSLAEKGYRVFYINSMGLRTPTATGRDVSRMLRKLKKLFQKPKKVRSNIIVYSPVVMPGKLSSLMKSINRILFNIYFNFWNMCYSNKKNILWSYSPVTLDIMKLNQFDQVIYHCVDEYKDHPLIDEHYIASAEPDFVKKADFVFCTSKKLFADRKKVNPQTYYHSNVVDFTHFSNSEKALQSGNFDDIKRISAPILGFVGAISSYKVDFQLLMKIASEKPNWNIVLIGEVGEGDPKTNVDCLRDFPNIHFLGPKSYSCLPAYMSYFTIALLPCLINGYTQAMFPMKFYEYLAAGVPVVSTDLPALKVHENYFYLANNHEEYVSFCQDAILNTESIFIESGRNLASLHTYEARTNKMIEIISTAFDKKRDSVIPAN